MDKLSTFQSHPPLTIAIRSPCAASSVVHARFPVPFRASFFYHFPDLSHEGWHLVRYAIFYRPFDATAMYLYVIYVDPGAEGIEDMQVFDRIPIYDQQVSDVSLPHLSQPIAHPDHSCPVHRGMFNNL